LKEGLHQKSLRYILSITVCLSMGTGALISTLFDPVPRPKVIEGVSKAELARSLATVRKIHQKLDRLIRIAETFSGRRPLKAPPGKTIAFGDDGTARLIDDPRQQTAHGGPTGRKKHKGRSK
jgi:hypothetical protein